MDQKRTKSMLQQFDLLTKLLLNPSSGPMAVELIVQTQKIHVAAIAGLLHKADSQEAIDEAYVLIDKYMATIKEKLYEVMYFAATANGLKPKAISDVNLATRIEAEDLLAKAEAKS